MDVAVGLVQGDAGLELVQRVLVCLDAAKLDAPVGHVARAGACFGGDAMPGEGNGLDLLPWHFGSKEGEDVVLAGVGSLGVFILEVS